MLEATKVSSSKIKQSSESARTEFVFNRQIVFRDNFNQLGRKTLTKIVLNGSFLINIFPFN